MPASTEDPVEAPYRPDAPDKRGVVVTSEVDVDGDQEGAV